MIMCCGSCIYFPLSSLHSIWYDNGINIIVKYQSGKEKSAYRQILLLGAVLAWFGIGQIFDVHKVSMQEKNGE